MTSAPGGSPKVVALMPTWKAAGFVRETLESLAAQQYANLEVLISDDASPDATASICADFATRHEGFRLFRQPRNLGWIGNVNWLLAHARGDYFFFAFHDDPLEPQYVASLVAALESNPRAVLAFTDIRLGPHVESYRDLDGVHDRVERARRFIAKRGRWWIPNRGLFRAAAAERVGGVRRHLAGEYSADWPWLLHLALLGDFVRVPAPLIRKVWRNDGVSVSWGRSLWKSSAVLLSCMREVRRARLPIREEAIVQGELVGYGLRASFGALAGRVARATARTSSR
ncbi:MAG TPA: glycosyltransferase family 2 protein [Casimicrobiaceae bacterium]|nr:glycosyltransferase family 2 protein [Casimicrobiaceae bacterium]